MNTMTMNSGDWGRNAVEYSTVESLLEDMSKQMALSNLTRFSRNSNAPYTGRASCGSMRVVKPNSANNSPRGSMGMGRRRTVMADSTYRRMAPVADEQIVPSMSTGYISNDGLQVPPRSSRPVSWHPSSQQFPQQSQPYYQTPTYEFNNQQFSYLPPTPAVYSGYTSPVSNFSPASIPYTGYEQQYFPDLQQHYLASQPSYLMEQQIQYSPSSVVDLDSIQYPQCEWNGFVANSFESSTAPPTPDNFLPNQHPEPSFPSEESIPYQSLDDDESRDDLVGLGLYDTPEAAKSPEPDPQLDNYRMMNQLLEFNYRRPEPAGKGLKLEEGWTPPSDDEKDDDEADGEGEDEEEEEKQPEPVETQTMPQGNWV
ncbi:hypothetical protein HYALB_00012583 [Hymenoscyphus albidus]|uniref:Uncharacterized protein n=1 Tax=Hymenoscyphus albidus TaxID=595503 RepID=A0A9N9LP52_9HELO|nr:hypothetical protein HYALB_00012583 [Hymenoscyphus albidus]